MVWTAFEIVINCVQGLLTLMFVKQCFAYEKQHPVADAALVLSCAGLLTFLLSRHMLFVDQLLYVFPDIHCILADRHDAALQHDFGGDLSHL